MTCIFPIVYLIPILTIIFSRAISSADQEKNVCKTPDCYSSSEILKLAMNSTVDPCENFYEYACGNFPSYKEGKFDPDDSYNWLIEIDTNLTIRVKELINSNISAYGSKAEEKMHLFYKSCMDEKKMNIVGKKTVKEIMSELGLQYVGFSNIMTGYKFNWFRAAAKIKKILGIDFLINTQIVLDEFTNATKLQISNPESCTPPFLKTRDENEEVSSDDVFKSKEFSKYAMDINEIFLDMYEVGRVPIFRSKLTGESAVEDMANFMMKRVQMCKKNSKAKNILTMLEDDLSTSYTRISLKSLVEKTNFASTDSGKKSLFDWEVYLSTLFEGIDGVNVDDELEIEIEEHLLVSMIDLLKDTSTKTLAVTLWFDAFTLMIPFSTYKLRNLDHSLKEDLGMKVTTWDEDLCHPLVKKHFGLVLMHQFINDPEVLDGKQRATEMVSDLKYALHEVIGKSEWMDEQTRIEAEKKINEMGSWISHPSWLSNGTLLDAYYENYKIIEENFLLTLISILREKVRRNLALIDKDSIVEDMELNGDLSPMTVNAGYAPEANLIVVPFGIMHKPIFGHTLAAMNYGGLGTIIGHEVTHGFDTTGRKYDEKGQQRDWWKKKTLTKYKENAKCFIDAYNNIQVKFWIDNDTSIHFTCDGEKTLDENIADNGGMREALIAYRKYVSSHGEEPLLVGFENFSHEQLFTLTYANVLVWCNNSSMGQLATNILTDAQDEHAENEARVNGVFMNSEDMAKIWKCPKGSPMNPEKKCNIW